VSFPLLTDTFQWLAGPKSLNSSIQQRVEQVACTTRFAFKLPRPPFIPAVPTAAEEVGGASQLAMPKTYPKKLQLYGASAATGDRRLPSDNPGQKKNRGNREGNQFKSWGLPIGFGPAESGAGNGVREEQGRSWSP
jgi:hypothetical protein